MQQIVTFISGEVQVKTKVLESWVCLAVCLVSFAGCGGMEKFDTTPTKGIVLCNGDPVEGAIVFFEPLKSGDSGLVGKSAVGRTDAKGEFVLTTYDEGDGAVIGRHRVRVGAPEVSGWECDCQTNSEVNIMEVDVTADGNTNFKVELPKKNRRAKTLDDDPDEDED
jgi:hypothetical protein